MSSWFDTFYSALTSFAEHSPRTDVKTFSSVKCFLFVLFCASFIIRAAIFILLINKGDNAWIYPDSVQYHTAAEQMVSGHGMVNPDGTPQVYRLPGYPLFLAMCYKIFGINVFFAQWIQIILASIIPILIFLLASVLFPSYPAVAYVSGICAAVHIGLSVYASMITTETLFLLFLLIFFIRFFAHSKNNFLTGCILGASSMIRPVGVYMIVIALFELCTGRIQCGSMLAGWSCTVAPWLIRNFLITGCIFFHTLPGLHFLQYSAAYVVMERDNCGYGDVRPMLLKQWDDAVAQQEKLSGKPCNEYERCVVAERIAYSYMKAHPWYTIKTACIQMLKTCGSLYTAQTLLSDSGVWPDYTRTTTLWTKVKRFLSPAVRHTILIPLIYAELALYLFMALGLLFFAISFWWRNVLFALPYIFMFIVITMAYGCARLRFPIEPFIIIFSGAGWVWICSVMRLKKSIF